MPESKLHKRLKRKHAGKTGYTEFVLLSGRRIDAVSPTGIVTEIELDGVRGIKDAVSRLKEAERIGLARKKKLVVRPEKVPIARREMRCKGVGGEIVTPDGKTKVHVPKRRKSTR